MMVSNRNLLFQGFIFRFHVSFPGCISHVRWLFDMIVYVYCDRIWRLLGAARFMESIIPSDLRFFHSFKLKKFLSGKKTWQWNITIFNRRCISPWIVYIINHMYIFYILTYFIVMLISCSVGRCRSRSLEKLRRGSPSQCCSSTHQMKVSQVPVKKASP